MKINVHNETIQWKCMLYYLKLITFLRYCIIKKQWSSIRLKLSVEWFNIEDAWQRKHDNVRRTMIMQFQYTHRKPHKRRVGTSTYSVKLDQINYSAWPAKHKNVEVEIITWEWLHVIRKNWPDNTLWLYPLLYFTYYKYTLNFKPSS